MRKINCVWFVVFCFLGAVLGCSSGAPPSKPEAAPTKKAAKSEATTLALDDKADPVVAEFCGNGLIRLSTLKKFTEREEKRIMPTRIGDTVQSIALDLRRRRLDQIIDEELLYRKAQDVKIELSEASLDSMIEEIIKKQYEGSREKLLAQLVTQHIELKDLRAMMQRRYMTNEIKTRTMKEMVHVDDAEIEPYYTSHIDKYTTPNIFDVHFLVIKSDDPNAKEEAKKRIETLRAEIVSQIEPIQDIEAKTSLVTTFCREHSQDENNMGGSWWRVFGREGKIDAALEESAEAAPLGEFGAIYELKNKPGFVTAFKKKYLQSEVKPFNDDLRQEIHSMLYKERFDKALEEFKELLRKDADIRLYQDKIALDLPTEAMKPGQPPVDATAELTQGTKAN